MFVVGAIFFTTCADFFYIMSWQNHLFYRLDRNSDCENNMVKLIRLTAIFRNKHNEQRKLNKLAKRHARSSLHMALLDLHGTHTWPKKLNCYSAGFRRMGVKQQKLSTFCKALCVWDAGGCAAVCNCA